MDGINALRETFDREIHRLDAESSRHKQLHRRQRALIIILTAATSIVAGAGLILAESSGRTIQFCVLALAAVTAALTSWAESRHARELWQHEREIHYALVDLKREMDFRAAVRGLSETDLERYFNRLTGVLGSSTRKWVAISKAATTAPARME